MTVHKSKQSFLFKSFNIFNNYTLDVSLKHEFFFLPLELMVCLRHRLLNMTLCRIKNIQMTTHIKRHAFFDTLPLCLAVTPWGMLCGSLGLQMGLDIWQAQAMSLLVFAGAVQLSALGLFGAGASFSAMLTSSLVISARHLLYSADMRQHILQLPTKWRLSLGFLLTDEMYALSVAHTQKTGGFDRHYALISGFTFYALWNLATCVGIILGSQAGDLTSLGLEFAIAATFIALVVPYVKTHPVVACVLTSGIMMFVLTYYAVSQALLLATASGMIVGFILDSQHEQRQRKNTEEASL